VKALYVSAETNSSSKRSRKVPTTVDNPLPSGDHVGSRLASALVGERALGQIVIEATDAAVELPELVL
jgi:hypothetical protein